MTKKHFIALADALRRIRPIERNETNSSETWLCLGAQAAQWDITRDVLANFCQSQNPRFNRERWIAYINGECGPNGGAIKD